MGKPVKRKRTKPRVSRAGCVMCKGEKVFNVPKHSDLKRKPGEIESVILDTWSDEWMNEQGG